MCHNLYKPWSESLEGITRVQWLLIRIFKAGVEQSSVTSGIIFYMFAAILLSVHGDFRYQFEPFKPMAWLTCGFWVGLVSIYVWELSHISVLPLFAVLHADELKYNAWHSRSTHSRPSPKSPLTSITLVLLLVHVNFPSHHLSGQRSLTACFAFHCESITPSTRLQLCGIPVIPEDAKSSTIDS